MQANAQNNPRRDLKPVRIKTDIKAKVIIITSKREDNQADAEKEKMLAATHNPEQNAGNELPVTFLTIKYTRRQFR
jgi:hypothetical protein